VVVLICSLCRSHQKFPLEALLLQQEGSSPSTIGCHVMLMVLPAWSDHVTLAQLMHHVSGIPETENILLNKGFQPQDRVKRAPLRKAITAGP
jgi:hypothetical protein